VITLVEINFGRKKLADIFRIDLLQALIKRYLSGKKYKLINVLVLSPFLGKYDIA
jgi:hypothetical protein